MTAAAARTCPKCDQPMHMDTANRVWRCRKCLHRIELPPETLDEAAARMATRPRRPVTRLIYRGELDKRARAVYENAADALWAGDKAEARRQFIIATGLQPDFTDAHYQLAALADDDIARRDHLSAVLAYDPGHPDALRDLMVLNGQLTPEQAARTHHVGEPEIRQLDQVQVNTQAMQCPICGGDMTKDDARGLIVCRFCGREEAVQTRFAAGQGKGMALGMALLKRKADPVKWVIGERIMHCTECGADRTLTDRRTAMACPFCGSKQVVTQDAADTLYQPDGLVPFEVDETQAKGVIRERLERVDEKLAGLLTENRVARAGIEGMYLPFWVFDAQLDVTVTRTRKQNTDSRRNQWQQMTQPSYNSTRTLGGVNGILVPAFKSPPPVLFEAIDEYAIIRMIPYDHTLLASHAAALYDVDFDDASLIARSKAIDETRRDHDHGSTDDYDISVTAWPLQMSFIQVLLPVWIGTLVERDGDVRTAVINGQTGRIALGKSRKPR